MKDYRKLAKAARKDACADYPKACRNCGAKHNCGSIRIHKALDAIDELLDLHALDLSEIVSLRRQVEALTEGKA